MHEINDENLVIEGNAVYEIDDACIKGLISNQQKKDANKNNNDDLLLPLLIAFLIKSI